ncbi:hypothetical protein [Actinomadura harenae]|uniref:YtxH domain-containing protein n=1 Tax=Actinomadura harenae TaxID=2483351 RepID=A0A3M2MIC5_9ACTN|nr:hypothetical protein [Actinomadura harenae]RMI47068.1 hypothetical protein EBO15_04010 [Actinomadura harenae]
MRYRVPFVVGLMVGYVLGARAGRERYEQIRRASRKVAGSPAVKGAAGAVRERASDAGGRVVEKAREHGGPAPKGSGHGAHGPHHEKAHAGKAHAHRGRGRGRKGRRHGKADADAEAPGMEAGRENADF